MSLFLYDYTSASITYFCWCKILALPNLLTAPVLGLFYYPFNASHKIKVKPGHWGRDHEKEWGQYEVVAIQSELAFSQLWHWWVKYKLQMKEKNSKRCTERFWSNILHQLQTHILESFLTDIKLCARHELKQFMTSWSDWRTKMRFSWMQVKAGYLHPFPCCWYIRMLLLGQSRKFSTLLLSNAFSHILC